MKESHGEKGHLNIYVRDHDSVISGFGKHDRCVCFLPKYDSEFDAVVMYCRVDHKWKLGEPAPDQIIKVARKDQGVKGKFKLAKIEEWDCGKSTDYYFIKQ